MCHTAVLDRQEPKCAIRAGKHASTEGSGETIRLQARVLRLTPLSHDQKITARDGRHTLTATVRRSWQLAFYILSQGERMTVLKPKSLRDEIVATLRRSIEQYESA
ncbi:MAG: WYL domain-containing protein [Akkermansiaceae bacterium]|nr:WYL domain-containing protein [Akkermansiaceae bacterium]MCP5547198.1 WYL domain-containing protein [Akkermansiaceae bacterium]